jgi:putative ABC transport system permease protein
MDRDSKGRPAAAPIEDELEFHFAEAVEALVTRGWSEAAARAEVERRFGDLGRYRRTLEKIDRPHGLRRWGAHLEAVGRDLRYGLRTLLRTPGFTLIALVALALGIGANTAVFSVVDGVLLRPLPFADPDRLVLIGNFTRRGGVSEADFLDWQVRSRSFASLDVFEINRFTNSRFTLTGDGEPEQVIGHRVTATFFQTLGVGPALGRTFFAGEDQPGQPPGVVLSDRLWRRRYRANAGVLGSSVVLNGRPHVIRGVMPSGFEFWDPTVDAWAIFPLDPPTRRGPFFLRGVGRLKPGVTMEQAAAEMDGIAREIERAHPSQYNRFQIWVTPLREIVVGDVRPLLWVLSGAVVLVLLIAVSNVANLTLGRASARRREIAIRLGIGASRGRLIRQLMSESLLLSLIGGALGTILGVGGVAALRALGPAGLPRLAEITVDTRVLVFTLATSVVSAMLFGLMPALTASGVAPADSLKSGARGGESPRQTRPRALLVVGQVTLSIILLVGAGLLIRSFSLLERVDPGFRANPDHVLTMFVSPTGPQFDKDGAITVYWARLLERIRTLPGVEAASLSNALPPDRRGFFDGYEIEGQPRPPGSPPHPSVHAPYVSQGYFDVLGIPLLRGRGFDDRDTPVSTRVTVISEAMARKHFDDENPVGRRILYGRTPLEIIGVAADVKYQGLQLGDEPMFYQLASQAGFWDLWLLVRTRGRADAMAAGVRQEIRAVDAGVPVDRIGTMADGLAESVSLPRFRSLLMAAFAITALLLAAIGIYGVVSYSVAQRRQEIGVRMALGATPSGVLAGVMRRGSRPVLLGVALGLAGAVGLARLLDTMLFGVTPFDALTFVGAALVLTAVALAASVMPALRAARTDPVSVLRQG